MADPVLGDPSAYGLGKESWNDAVTPLVTVTPSNCSGSGQLTTDFPPISRAWAAPSGGPTKERLAATA
ncbi:hypothetical protein [Streptomyces sp. NPDC052042]|uniref:hypothetical protein n=1 Tax=Streptomyces sp. NPDC052042 TaxID=3365683 RepID=UPI0037CCEAA0